VHTLATMNGLNPNEELRAGQKLRLSSVSGSRPTTGSARRVVYTVRTGDTLAQIARLFQVSVSQILSWNSMHSHSSIQAGQKLTIRLATRRSS